MSSGSGAKLVLYTYTFFGIGATCVAIRLIVRWRRLHAVKSEDACIVGALLASFVCSLSIHFQVERGGLGLSYGMLSKSKVSNLFKGLYSAIIAYNVSLCLTQFSIAFLTLSILSVGRSRTVCHVAIIVLSLYTLWIIGISVIHCVPLTRFWNRSVRGWCAPTYITYVNASMSIAIHFFVVLLPVPALMGLHLPWTRRIGLSFLFSVGLFVCVLSVLRLVFLHENDIKHDPAYDITISIWSSVECNVAIIGACLPTLYSLVAGFHFRKLFCHSFAGSSWITKLLTSQDDASELPGSRA